VPRFELCFSWGHRYTYQLVCNVPTNWYTVKGFLRLLIKLLGSIPCVSASLLLSRGTRRVAWDSSLRSSRSPTEILVRCTVCR
jgi:hypothetical protein